MTELVRVLALTALASALLLPVAKREKELAQVSAGLLYLSVFLYAMAQLGGLLGTVRTWLDSAGASVHMRTFCCVLPASHCFQRRQPRSARRMGSVPPRAHWNCSALSK